MIASYHKIKRNKEKTTCGTHCGGQQKSQHKWKHVTQTHEQNFSIYHTINNISTWAFLSFQFSSDIIKEKKNFKSRTFFYKFITTADQVKRSAMKKGRLGTGMSSYTCDWKSMSDSFQKRKIIWNHHFYTFKRHC